MNPLPSRDLEHILDHTRPLWERLRGSHLFLSGATGFFGAWLLESLVHCDRQLQLGLSATVVSRNPEAFLEKMPHLAGHSSISFIKGDIRNFAFPEGEFDSVIHGAASTSLDAASRPAELMSTLIHGTERMIRLAKERGTKRLLYISSGAVYGRQPDSLKHIPEDYRGGPDWIDPNSVYGEGKRVSEQMCSLYALETGVRVAMARCFTLLGPHLPLDQHFAVGNFICDAIAGRSIAVKGDGSPIRSYIYAADLTIWLWTLLLRADDLPTNPFPCNIGSSEEISIAELASAVASALDPALKVEIASKTKLAERQPRYVPDVQKARKTLGLVPWIGLEDAIRRTAEWSKASAHEAR